jgi:LuxR family maltose regulon positive regulatory protein
VVRRVARQTVSNWLQHTAYRVHTLGSFRLYREDRMLSDQVWVRAGVKRLFLYLVTNHGKWLSCDVIMEALWKDPHPVRTRKMLSNQFSDLRRIIEPWRLPGWEYQLLRSQRDAYGLFPQGRIWVDADEFLENVKAGDAALLKRGFREARKSYREALELYVGEYLEEQPYDDWVSGRRGQLTNAYFRAVLSYARLERDSGNPAEARRALEEALFKDPSRSECMALLQELLLAMGLSKEAREWAARHRKYSSTRLHSKKVS